MSIIQSKSVNFISKIVELYRQLSNYIENWSNLVQNDNLYQKQRLKSTNWIKFDHFRYKIKFGSNSDLDLVVRFEFGPRF